MGLKCDELESEVKNRATGDGRLELCGDVFQDSVDCSIAYMTYTESHVSKDRTGIGLSWPFTTCKNLPLARYIFTPESENG